MKLTLDGRWNGARLGSGCGNQVSALYVDDTEDYCCLGICAVDTGVVSDLTGLNELYALSDIYCPTERADDPPEWVKQIHKQKEYVKVVEDAGVEWPDSYYDSEAMIQFEQMLIHVNDHPKIDLLDKVAAISALFHAFTPIEVEVKLEDILNRREGWLTHDEQEKDQ